MPIAASVRTVGLAVQAADQTAERPAQRHVDQKVREVAGLLKPSVVGNRRAAVEAVVPVSGRAGPNLVVVAATAAEAKYGRVNADVEAAAAGLAVSVAVAPSAALERVAAG